jgi:hypothetical protein
MSCAAIPAAKISLHFYEKSGSQLTSISLGQHMSPNNRIDLPKVFFEAERFFARRHSRLSIFLGKEGFVCAHHGVTELGNRGNHITKKNVTLVCSKPHVR